MAGRAQSKQSHISHPRSSQPLRLNGRPQAQSGQQRLPDGVNTRTPQCPHQQTAVVAGAAHRFAGRVPRGVSPSCARIPPPCGGRGPRLGTPGGRLLPSPSPASMFPRLLRRGVSGGRPMVLALLPPGNPLTSDDPGMGTGPGERCRPRGVDAGPLDTRFTRFCTSTLMGLGCSALVPPKMSCTGWGAE